VLGICAGGDHAVNATMTDHRIKVVATVSGLNIGASYRKGLVGHRPRLRRRADASGGRSAADRRGEGRRGRL
jgi:hypothetical protein